MSRHFITMAQIDALKALIKHNDTSMALAEIYDILDKIEKEQFIGRVNEKKQ